MLEVELRALRVEANPEAVLSKDSSAVSVRECTDLRELLEGLALL